MRAACCLAMCVLLMSCCPVRGQQPDEAFAAGDAKVSDQATDRFAGMGGYMRAALQKWRVPGLAVAVIHKGQVLTARGYGVRELGRDAPVTPETVFSIASCTKSFTAAAVARQIAAGRLTWDDRISQHLPEFRVADPYVTAHVTLRDVLCHRTGLVTGQLLPVRGDLSREEMLRRLRHLGQAKPFRTQHTYNNVMFLAVEQVLTRVSGQAWEQVVADELLRPLGMQATYCSHDRVPPELKAIRHRQYNDGVHRMRHPETDTRVPAAGAMYSTVGDMCRWLSLHIQLGRAGERQLIPRELMQDMHALQMSIPVPWRPGSDVYRPTLVGTGLGWFTRDYRGRKVVDHGGAWGAEMAFVPEEELGVIVLSNLDRNGLGWMLKWDLIDSVLSPETAWERGAKWEKWEQLGGYGVNFRERDRQKARLTEQRQPDRPPTHTIERLAGRYESPLYGEVQFRPDGAELDVTFGNYSARLQHWDGNSYYGVAVVEPFLDWLVKFQPGTDRADDQLEIVSVGWANPDDRHIYRRAKD